MSAVRLDRYQEIGFSVQLFIVCRFRIIMRRVLFGIQRWRLTAFFLLNGSFRLYKEYLNPDLLGHFIHEAVRPSHNPGMYLFPLPIVIQITI